MSSFSKLPNLKVLELRDSEVTDEGLLLLPALTQLTRLDLNSRPITDTGIKDLAKKFPSLEWLILRRTEVTDDSLEEIAKLKNLKLLDIQDTNTTADRAEDLRKKTLSLDVLH
ncbi:MAG: hypothetical protein R3C11_13340 [Planctomycetaceae bacterium]